MKTSFFAALLIAASTSVASAATFNLNPGDDLQAAIDGAISGDELVLAAGTYSGTMLVEKSLIIRGADPSDRPVIVLGGLSSQPTLGPGDGIYLGVEDGGSATLQDLILIPGSGMTDDVISASVTDTGSPDASADYIFTNILIAPNDGSDQPLTTDPYNVPDLEATGVITVPDDGIYLMDDDFSGVDGNMNATFTNYVTIGVGGDAMVVYPGDGEDAGGTAGVTELTVVFEGVIAANSGRYGIQFSDTDAAVYNFVGTKADPSFIAINNENIGIVCFQGKDINMDHAVSVGNALGVRVDFDTVGQFDMTNCLIANNSGEGFWSDFSNTAAKTWTISGSTFYNNGVGADTGTDDPIANIKFETGVDNLTLEITDTLITGTTTGFENLGTGTITADFVGLDSALTAVERNTSTGPVTITNETTGAPSFTSTSAIPLEDNSFDLQILGGSNPFQGAGTGGADLGGWGDFVVVTNTGNAWSMYE